MAIGLDNPISGYAAYAAIKASGYCLFAKIEGPDFYPNCKTSYIKIGLTRTLIGIVAGLLCWKIFAMGMVFHINPIIGVLLLRIFEWWLLIWIFYDRHLKEIKNGWQFVFFGILCSFLLDFIAVFGVGLIGGLWIC